MFDSSIRSFRHSHLALFVFVTACGGFSPAPPSHLPPSASDLDVLGPIKICEPQTTSLLRWKGLPVEKASWGTGEELYLKETAPQQKVQWLFFNEDGTLIGAVVTYADGLDLEPYPVLRRTLSQLTPAREFFLDASNLLRGTQPDSVQLYRTGDETTTTQYIVRRRAGDDNRDLLVAVRVLDPYEHLLEGYQDKFLSPSTHTHPDAALKTTQKGQPSGDHTFLANQEFARGEAALFKSCQDQQDSTDIAIDAYSRAIQIGMSNPKQLAEAHHRLGLALRNKGQFIEARKELEQSLKIRPHAPSVLNSLGSVLIQLHKTSQAIESLEKAIILKPNYARARFNLAEAYEAVNPQRAKEEYETYLVLVEGIPEESTRAALAKDRLERLK